LIEQRSYTYTNPWFGGDWSKLRFEILDDLSRVRAIVKEGNAFSQVEATVNGVFQFESRLAMALALKFVPGGGVDDGEHSPGRIWSDAQLAASLALQAKYQADAAVRGMETNLATKSDLEALPEKVAKAVVAAIG